MNGRCADRATGQGPRVLAVLAGLVLAGLLAAGCVDGAVLNLAMGSKSRELPTAADNLVVGRIVGDPEGATVVVYSGGDALDGVTARFPEIGGFEIPFRGNTEFSGLRVEARWAAGQAFGIVPILPKQRSVMCAERVLACLDGAPERCEALFLSSLPECRSGNGPALMPVMGAPSTAYTLALLGKAIDGGRSLSSLSCVLADQVAELEALDAGGNAAVRSFVALVDGWLAFAGRDGRYPFAGALPPGATVDSLVDGSFLEAFAAQLPAPAVGCGQAAPSNPATPGDQLCAFAAGLRAAAAEVTVAARYAEDRIRVVFLADFRAGARTGNCTVVDRFKWAKDLPGKKLFITGGIHKTTPVCGPDVPEPHCVPPEKVDEANQVLGNWVPNIREMSDDGTRGDAVRGDNIWTFVADLPRITVDDAARRPGVRVGYKFTWGLPGQGWTDSEEWPGNQRLLELVDVNNDGLVVRLDVFSDEAANKDKANELSPSNGGCGGVNLWESDPKPSCSRYLHDTRERRVDLDGDAQCLPDGHPPAGPVSPITLDCG